MGHILWRECILDSTLYASLILLKIIMSCHIRDGQLQEWLVKRDDDNDGNDDANDDGNDDDNDDDDDEDDDNNNTNSSIFYRS